MTLPYALLTGIAFLVTGVFWLLFAQLTMRRIERDIKAAQLRTPAPWDGVGYRIFGFARAVIFSEQRLKASEEIMVDAYLIRQFAQPRDRLLAAAFLISTYSFVAIVLVGIFLF